MELVVLLVGLIVGFIFGAFFMDILHRRAFIRSPKVKK